VAKVRYDKRRRHEFHTTGRRRLVPAYRLVRRVRALQALGYSMGRVAAEAGLRTSSLYNPLYRGESVSRASFEAVAAAYERLCMTPAPGRYAARERRWAARKGWLPPLAWDDIDDAEAPGSAPPVAVDLVVVDRVLGGEYHLTCTAGERLEVIARWAATGRSLNDLARLTGWNVWRLRRGLVAA